MLRSELLTPPGITARAAESSPSISHGRLTLWRDDVKPSLSETRPCSREPENGSGGVPRDHFAHSPPLEQIHLTIIHKAGRIMPL